MPAQSTTPRKLRGRPFAKGYDSRWHVFTPEECRAGFYAAIAAIATRNPNATFYNVMDYFQQRRAAQTGGC
ncbi:MAG TPA: hypothetical protein VF546_05435 [Pyrinomonadaceae bacterium]|jgi:hypothetical protein